MRNLDAKDSGSSTIDKSTLSLLRKTVKHLRDDRKSLTNKLLTVVQNNSELKTVVM